MMTASYYVNTSVLSDTSLNTWDSISNTGTWTTANTSKIAALNNYLIVKASGHGRLIEMDTDEELTKIIKIDAGSKEIHLPDGTKIIVDNNGNYQINDKDAKIIYKGCRIKEFNKYVNAGDLIEEFIKDVGKLGITQGQLLKIPINVFFTWLIAKSAIEDEVDIPSDVPRVENMREVKDNIRPRCKHCQRFLSLNKVNLGINFCNDVHLGRFMNKNQALLARK